jgi:soluble lytic murein transglycosylase-like protein
MIRLIITAAIVVGSVAVAVVHDYNRPAAVIEQSAQPIRNIETHENTLYTVSINALRAEEAARKEAYIQQIKAKYKVDAGIAEQVVEYAHKHAKEEFPTAKDILAVVGIESSFRPSIQSGLRVDPAIGLMQIRARVWRTTQEEMLDIEQNVERGAAILEDYYYQLDRRKYSAVQAYNIGITAYRQGEKNLEYLKKFRQERALYARY